MGSVGAFVRARRRELGWTQEDLAERLGRDQTYVSQIELGKARPTAEGRERLARALMVEVRELIRAEFGVVGPDPDTPAPEDDLDADAFALALDFIRNDPETQADLARLKAACTPAQFERAMIALAHAWKANFRLMVTLTLNAAGNGGNYAGGI